MKLLLEHGANVDVRDAMNNTPLHEAAIKCDLSMIALLISHGANPFARNKEGSMPILQALESLSPGLMCFGIASVIVAFTEGSEICQIRQQANQNPVIPPAPALPGDVVINLDDIVNGIEDENENHLDLNELNDIYKTILATDDDDEARELIKQHFVDPASHHDQSVEVIDLVGELILSKKEDLVLTALKKLHDQSLPNYYKLAQAFGLNRVILTLAQKQTPEMMGITDKIGEDYFLEQLQSLKGEVAIYPKLFETGAKMGWAKLTTSLLPYNFENKHQAVRNCILWKKHHVAIALINAGLTDFSHPDNADILQLVILEKNSDLLQVILRCGVNLNAKCWLFTPLEYCLFHNFEAGALMLLQMDVSLSSKELEKIFAKNDGAIIKAALNNKAATHANLHAYFSQNPQSLNELILTCLVEHPDFEKRFKDLVLYFPTKMRFDLGMKYAQNQQEDKAYALLEGIEEDKVTKQEYATIKSQCAHIILSGLAEEDNETQAEFRMRKYDAVIDNLLEAKDKELVVPFIIDRYLAQQANKKQQEAAPPIRVPSESTKHRLD